MNELPDTNAAEAQRWLGQAEEELLTAGRIASDEQLPPRIACFLAHLAAEKAIKACLISFGMAFTKVHDLGDLRALLPIGIVDVSDEDLELLNPWAIEGRYPGDARDATSTQADECVRAAERVLATTRAALESKNK